MAAVKGKQEAKDCALLLNEIKFDVCYTSNLKRAFNTLKIVLENINQDPPIFRSEALNERDYGDLIGKNKQETALKFGDKQVEIWRRSYDIPPPNGESLKMTCDRVIPYFENTIIKDINYNNYKNILISAHGNSIRAIIMYLLKYNRQTILKTEVGWCEPWIFSFNNNKLIGLNILSRTNSKSKSILPINPFINTKK